MLRRACGQGEGLFTNALLREVFRRPSRFPDNNDSRPDLLPPSLRSTSAVADRFRHLSMLLIVAAASLAVVLGIAFGVRVDPSGTSMIELGLAALLILSRIWSAKAGMHRVADALGTVGTAAIGGLCCGAVAMLELRLGFPLADGMLHRAGMDAMQVLAVIGRQRDVLLPVLAPVYNNTLELFFGSLVVLSLVNDRIEAWRAAFCFVGTLLTTCVVAAFIPATGLINWAPPHLLAHLPQAFMTHFSEFYYGVDPVLRLQVIDGTISFPSFHAVVGFLVFSMWRKRLVTRVAAAIWLAVELLSTVAGGHYAVDLIGGFVVWGGWFALSCLVEKRIAHDAMSISADQPAPAAR